MKAAKKRCAWAEVSDAMRQYHDTEWGVPQHDDRVLFEYILLDSFQAGLSWAVILHKRENFRKAFAGFDPVKIARFNERKVQSLLEDVGIVRNRAKIEAAIQNAKVFLVIQKEFGGFSGYLWAWGNDKPIKNRWRLVEEVPARTELSDRISADLKKRGFRFFGSTCCYAFLQGAGLVNDHLTSCFRHREI